MIKKSRGAGLTGLQSALGATFGVLALCVPVVAQGVLMPPVSPRPNPAQPAANPPPPYQPASNQPALTPATTNPVCARLEGQLAAFDQGAANPARAEQIKRSEDAITKQQADLDRAVAQAHKAGCAGQGFFALFSALSPQCGPITSQIQGMRGNLDRMMSDLEQLKSGSEDQQGQRRALIGQLAQNNCGAQYTAAANSQGGPRSFFEALFGGGTILNPNGDGAPSGTYHTVCVRSCDGYYFPISYSTLPTHFAEDQLTCQRECPAADVALYSFRNPGEGMDQAVSTGGQLYTTLPNAYRYRTALIAGCSCRRPGQSWADALKNADDSSTLESGDIVVTDQNAKALSQPPKPSGKAATSAATAPPAAAAATTPRPSAASTDDKKPAVRTVGPPFLSASQMSSPTSPAAQPQPPPPSR
ncbi:MAG TPA: DUF2865 domain-containing protein [Xanthobacteraceae bacterium]|nr:DUF2865 domain-containing protein [Xanthobacteraceae bacterium]